MLLFVILWSLVGAIILGFSYQMEKISLDCSPIPSPLLGLVAIVIAAPTPPSGTGTNALNLLLEAGSYVDPLGTTIPYITLQNLLDFYTHLCHT